MGRAGEKRKRGRLWAATAFALVFAVAAFLYFALPGPVFWVDLYWTAAIESGIVDPAEDFYPWTVAVDWSPDGKTVVSSGYHPDVFVWDAATGKLKHRLKGHGMWVQEVIFSPDGRFIASADWDGLAMVWDAETGKPLHRLRAKGQLFSLSFHPGEPVIAAASYDEGRVILFDLGTGGAISSFASNEGGTMFIAYSPDGTILAAGGEDARVNLFETSGYSGLGALVGHEDGVAPLSFSSDGALLLCGATQPAARLEGRSRLGEFLLLRPGNRPFPHGKLRRKHPPLGRREGQAGQKMAAAQGLGSMRPPKPRR